MDPDLVPVLACALGAEVVSSRPAHGGHVAVSYALDLADGRRVFAKTHPHAPPEFFATEATGLRWLRDGVASSDWVAVPEVLAVSDQDPSYLVLEWIDTFPPGIHDETLLGTALAHLHAAGAPFFGREDHRPTTSLQLPNQPATTWVEFYAASRLIPLAVLASDTGALPRAAIDGLERIAGRLATFGGADEAPSRLHGDLWAGNRLVGSDGRHWLIDPAAHGGHREFDLATMRLFGGFGPESFDAYDDVYPLAPGWEDRIVLHQIVPLVIHAIKLGGDYVGAATAAIDRYA